MNSISVIIPVYNSEKYIEECLNSILNQSSLPEEVIIIDDGSYDKSAEICESFAEKHQFIKVFHQENSGVTHARANGVAKSKSEWVTFVDSDDTLPCDAIAIFRKDLSPEYDIIVGEMFNVNDSRIISFNEYRHAMVAAAISTGPCAKMFRRKLFDGFTFSIPREVVYGEDMLMNIRIAFNNTKNVRLLGRKVYEYRRNEMSVSHTYNRTAEYEQMFSELRWRSIPAEFQTDYFEACLRNRLNAWRSLNFLKLDVSSNRRSVFYRQLINDINESGYRLSLSERVQLFSNSRIGRLFAVGCNILKVAINRILR